MDHIRFLARFADIARREILRDHIRASCVAATWITLEVFRRLGIAGSPLPVRATIGNGAYGRRVVQAGPPRSMDTLTRWGVEDGSYCVGVGFDATEGGIGGHLTALIGGEFLVDASLDQATSERNELRVPGVLVLQLRPGELESGIVRRVSSDLYLEYVPSPTAIDYSCLPDWGRTPEVESAVERILHALR